MEAQKRFEIQVGDWHIPTQMVSKFALVEKMQEFIPTLHLSFWFDGHQLDTKPIVRGQNVNITYQQTDPTAMDVEHRALEILRFKVEDLRLEYSPRTGRAHVELFCIPKGIDEDFYSGVRGHIAYHENISSIISGILAQTVGKCSPEISSEDSKLWIRNLESDSQFINRLIKHAWLGGRDFMFAFIDRHSEARVGSFLGLLNNRSGAWVFNAVSGHIEDLTAPSDPKTLEGALQNGKQDTSIPITGLKVTADYGTSVVSGITGIVYRLWDIKSQTYKMGTYTFDIIKPDGSGNFNTFFDHELGKFNKSVITSADETTVYDGYHIAKSFNEIFFKHLDGNSVEFACLYMPNLKLGQTFTILSEKLDEDGHPLKNDYMDGINFVVSEIESKMEGRPDFHTQSDTRLWMLVKGVAFGTDIGTESNHYNLLEINK